MNLSSREKMILLLIAILFSEKIKKQEENNSHTHEDIRYIHLPPHLMNVTGVAHSTQINRRP